MSIKILIADKYYCVRRGIRALIEEQPGMEVIAEADNGNILLQHVRKYKPDVVITEIFLPELDGIDATRQICKEFNTIRVISLSELCDRKSVESMFHAGAKGYLTKSSTPEELISAVRNVKEGHVYLCQRTADILAEDLVLFLNGKIPSVSSELTPQEHRVAKLYAEDYTTEEIARHLNVSKKTVAAHRENIKKKLGVKGIAGITKYAIREHLTSLY